MKKLNYYFLKLYLNLLLGLMKSLKFWKENFFIYSKQDFYSIKRTDLLYNNAPCWI